MLCRTLDVEITYNVINAIAVLAGRLRVSPV